MNKDRLFQRIHEAKTYVSGLRNWIENAEKHLHMAKGDGYHESQVANALKHGSEGAYSVVVELSRALQIAEEG